MSAKSQHVLDLQHQAGNAAVAGVVQRSLWGDDSWLANVGSMFPAGQRGVGGADTSKMPTGSEEHEFGGGAFDGKGGTFEKGGSGGGWKDPGYEQDGGTFDGQGGTFEKGGSKEGGFEDGSGKGVTFGEDGTSIEDDPTTKDGEVAIK